MSRPRGRGLCGRESEPFPARVARSYSGIAADNDTMQGHGEPGRAEQRTLELLGLFADRMPAFELAWMESLVVTGAAGVAFEDLCVQLYEHGVPVSPAEIVELALVGGHMRVDASYWQRFLWAD